MFKVLAVILIISRYTIYLSALISSHSGVNHLIKGIAYEPHKSITTDSSVTSEQSHEDFLANADEMHQLDLDRRFNLLLNMSNHFPGALNETPPGIYLPQEMQNQILNKSHPKLRNLVKIYKNLGGISVKNKRVIHNDLLSRSLHPLAATFNPSGYIRKESSDDAQLCIRIDVLHSNQTASEHQDPVKLNPKFKNSTARNAVKLNFFKNIIRLPRALLTHNGIRRNLYVSKISSTLDLVSSHANVTRIDGTPTIENNKKSFVSLIKTMGIGLTGVSLGFVYWL